MSSQETARNTMSTDDPDVRVFVGAGVFVSTIAL